MEDCFRVLDDSLGDSLRIPAPADEILEGFSKIFEGLTTIGFPQILEQDESLPPVSLAGDSPESIGILG